MRSFMILLFTTKWEGDRITEHKSPSRRYILWNQQINYSVQKRMPVKLLLSQLTPIHTLKN
jgi:hypothetical protein